MPFPTFISYFKSLNDHVSVLRTAPPSPSSTRFSLHLPHLFTLLAYTICIVYGTLILYWDSHQELPTSIRQLASSRHTFNHQLYFLAIWPQTDTILSLIFPSQMFILLCASLTVPLATKYLFIIKSENAVQLDQKGKVVG